MRPIAHPRSGYGRQEWPRHARAKKALSDRFNFRCTAIRETPGGPRNVRHDARELRPGESNKNENAGAHSATARIRASRSGGVYRPNKWNRLRRPAAQ